MSWNKGLTKETNPSVMKISRTMKRKKLDNFKNWRNRMKELGTIPKDYPPFSPSKNLAEFIGVVLGDGNIGLFPRTERLVIVGNSNNIGFIERYSAIAKRLFKKGPTVYRDKSENATRISIYQKHIAKRLGIPSGSRKNIDITIPNWIFQDKEILASFLRGLFEAEGSLSIHKPTCTYNFQFCNTNKSLLKVVEKGLNLLGYHPEVRNRFIRLRKRHEVLHFQNLIQFRNYSIAG